MEAHKAAIKTIGVLEEGPQILTGSLDGSIKVWGLSSPAPTLVTTVPTEGGVEHIEIRGNVYLVM